ncbi:MAG TPA: hypothetical protein VID28_16450 [Methylomirabilota bacterium]|jgi:hypothetical protein
MVTVSAETSLSSSLDDAWAALGRRATYFYFPGVSRSSSGTALDHALDLPIVDRQAQVATLSVARAPRDGPRERRFTLRGELVTIRGRWRLEPTDAGVRVRLTLDYDIAAPLKTHAVNTLRSRSPLPIRTDADEILSRAVDEFFETRFTEQAADYCERLRARLDGTQADRRA